MNTEEYMKETLKTESTDWSKIVERFSNSETIRALHGSIGLVTEAGELQDAFKKNLFYGKPIEEENILEECGDALFYISCVLRAYGFTFEQAMETNIRKLQARYEGSFSEERAVNRDLDTENEVLKEGADA